MANKEFIKQEMRYKRALNETVTMIYASFALSLHRRHGLSFEDIVETLSDTQNTWIRGSKGEIDVLKQCSDEVGIDMVSQNTANEYALTGDAII